MRSVPTMRLLVTGHGHAEVLKEQDRVNVLYSVRYNNDIIGYEVNPCTPQIAFEIEGELIKKRRNPADRSTHPQDNFFRTCDNVLAKYRDLSRS